MRRFLKSVIPIVGILLISFVCIHFWAHHKIKKSLSLLPTTIRFEYADFDINLLKGSLTLEDALFEMKHPDSAQPYTRLSLPQIKIDGIHYLEYLRNNTLELNHIFLKNPTMEFRPYAKQNDSTSHRISLKQLLKLDHVQIENGHVLWLHDAKDSVGVQLFHCDIDLQGIRISDSLSQSKPNIEWNELAFHADSLYAPLGPLDHLSTGAIERISDTLFLTNLQIQTNLAPKEFNKQLPHERDHYQLKVPSLQLLGMSLTKPDSLTQIDISKLVFQKPEFKVFRNKLLADDLSKKTLFSEKFRNLPFLLAIDSVQVNDAMIKYTEKDEYNNDGGSILFKDMTIDVSNMGNHFGENINTRITGKGLFMEEARLAFQWEFDVHDTNETFLFEANVDRLKATDLNVLTRNNMDLLLKGTIDECAFQIKGNDHASSCSFKIHYKDLQVELLNKKKGKKRWLQNKILNAFIYKTSERNGKIFQENDGVVERDYSKSFFNYLWLNVKLGLVKTLL